MNQSIASHLHDAPAPSSSPIRTFDVVMLTLAIAVVGLTGVFAGEHIGVYGGYGWDGITYQEVLREPAAAIAARAVDSYTLQRVVPSVIVGSAMGLFGIEPTGAAAARAFGLYNALLLTLCGVLWGMCARRLGMSRRGFFVGAAALFLSFAATKQASYYAVLTDVSAYALGMAVMAAFLGRSTLALAGLGLVGSFTWPVVLPLVVPLILWPRGTEPLEREKPGTLGAIIAGGVTLAVLLLFAFLHWHSGRVAAGKGPVVPVVAQLAPVSMVAFAAMAFGALFFLLRGLDWTYVARLVRSLEVTRCAVAVALVAAVVVGIRALAARGVAPQLPFRTFLGMVAITPMTRPLISIVAHFSYFGPWVLLLVAQWPRVVARIRVEGPGMLAFACGATILAFLPESRQSTFGVPALALFFASASDRMRISRPALVVFLTASILLTRFWAHYGTADTSDTTVYREYLSNHGPYMNNRYYITYAIAAAVISAALYVAMREPRFQGRRVG